MRDAFALAKEKAPAIIFIDELDAIGTKRFDSEKAGDREVQRTMLELLNQLDGFEPNQDIKVKDNLYWFMFGISTYRKVIYLMGRRLQILPYHKSQIDNFPSLNYYENFKMK